MNKDRKKIERTILEQSPFFNYTLKIECFSIIDNFKKKKLFVLQSFWSATLLQSASTFLG